MLTWLGLFAILAYAAVVAALYVWQRQLLFLPDTRRPALGELAKLGVREVTVGTEDGLALLCWYLPPREGRPVIAYFHGNGGNIGYRAERLRLFAGDDYGVLFLEYRGYGSNPGSPNEAGLVLDGKAALDFLEHQGVAARRRVLYGESLGSGVAVQLAVGREIGALVLEAPYTSVAAVAQDHYPFVPAAMLMRDRFDSLSRIGQVRAPILVMQGGKDDVVPPRLGQELFAAAPEPKEGWFPAEAGHNDLRQFGALEVVARFIDRWVR